jgi:hypothetical protein
MSMLAWLAAKITGEAIKAGGEVAKTATEIPKNLIETQKARLEIEELNFQKKERQHLITIATFEQVKEYDLNVKRIEKHLRWRVMAISAAATVLVGVGLVIGPAHFGNRRPQSGVPEGPVTPPQETRPGSIEQPTPTQPAVPLPPVSHTPAKPDTGQCLLSISNLLQYAGRYRDQHRYDEAEREYKRVLDCDHNNQEAKDGLTRTRIEKSLH